MSDVDLKERFPEMRPLRTVPSLFTLNGCGCCIYGARDHDEETGTYVKTHCFCLLFIPVISLGAYRVANAESGGWYFLGRVPLSPLAKCWNGLLVAALLALVGHFTWDKYYNSPSRIAGRQLAEADRLAEAGQIVPAARLYREVAQSGTEHAEEGAACIKGLVEGLDQAVLADDVEVFKIVVELRQRPGFANLFDRGLELVKKNVAQDPRGALALLDTIEPMAPKPDQLSPVRGKLLEQIVAREPNNPEPASRLAVVYESQDELAKCEPILAPHAQRLGTLEGGRILGQIYARQGKFEEAHVLLCPYTEGRLTQLHAAEKKYDQVLSGAHTVLLNTLQNGTAPGFPYQRYDRAGKDEQDALVRDYLGAKLKDDPGVKSALDAIRSSARVVPVALDLGIVLLQRARNRNDPALRRAELEKAEKTFLAVRGVAGESDEYRLNLGQVYYWLGKHAEGKKLFDDLLEAQKRDYKLLLSISRLLRELGAVTEARALVEEAYAQASEPAKKYEAAIHRSLMPVDLDDKIKWLKLSNPNEPAVKAALASALGNKALEKGQDEEAARQLREAIEIYRGQTENAATLNNAALAYSALFRATGDRAASDKAVEMLEKAVALLPSDSILIHNTAHGLLQGAMRDIIGLDIDLKTLKMDGNLGLLSYLIQDEAGKKKYVERVRQHAGIKKTLAYYDRLLVLAPKNASSYSSLASIHGFTRNLEALRGLEKRMEGVELDLDDGKRQSLDYFSGKDDAKLRQEMTAALERYASLVKATRKSAPGITFAVAAASLAGQKIHLSMLGGETDFEEIVALAEEAHAAAPSSATQATLMAALMARASGTLERQEPKYVSLTQSGRRSLGATYLIPLALDRGGNLRQACLGNADVQRAVALMRENVARFPDEGGPWTWALFRHTSAEDAARMAKIVLQDEVDRLERSIDMRLSPFSAADAYKAYWAWQIAGNEAEGIAVLKRCAARGVPIPLDK